MLWKFVGRAIDTTPQLQEAFVDVAMQSVSDVCSPQPLEQSMPMLKSPLATEAAKSTLIPLSAEMLKQIAGGVIVPGDPTWVATLGDPTW